MKVLSLFDGISCGMVALKRIGAKVERYDAYEIEENAIKVSKSNYPEINQKGDVFKAEYKEGEYDLLLGGSPCTFWSINKKNREVTSKGEGWELFMQYVRAFKEVKPKWFLYENNYGIHKDIQQEITKQLGVQPIMLNSSLFSAQKRKRLYWTNIPIREIPSGCNVFVKDILDDKEKEKDLSQEVVYNNKKEEEKNDLLRIGTIGKGGQGERVYSILGKSVNITANGGGRGAKTGLYKINDKVRKLNVLEVERLQTLPDGYTKGVSDTQRYKCLGNGWTVDVIAHILKGMEE